MIGFVFSDAMIGRQVVGKHWRQVEPQRAQRALSDHDDTSSAVMNGCRTWSIPTGLSTIGLCWAALMTA